MKKKVLPNISMKEEDAAVAIMHLLSEILDDIYFHCNAYMQKRADESLHQLRIGLRRSIVLSGEYRSLFTGNSFLKHRASLKKIISITNTKRDLDVMVSKLEEWKKKKRFADYQDTLGKLEASLLTKKKGEDDKILIFFESDACHRILKEWENYITEEYRSDISEQGVSPTISISRYLLMQRFLKIKKQIRKIETQENMGETLHKLRISFKKLRYMLETYYRLDMNKILRKLRKKSKKIQEILGDFHDLHQEILFFESLMKENEAYGALLGKVLKSLKKEQKKLFDPIKKSLRIFLKQEKSYREIFGNENLPQLST